MIEHRAQNLVKMDLPVVGFLWTALQLNTDEIIKNTCQNTVIRNPEH